MKKIYYALIFTCFLVIVMVSYIFLTHYYTVLERYNAAERSDKMEQYLKQVESLRTSTQ